jgi:hypothetical protein
MIVVKYILLLGFLLGGLLASLFQMGYALDEADIERFSMWTFVATIIASLPSLMW